MEGVFEQVTSIKWHHGDEVGEAQENVHPHQPEKEINHEHDAAYS